MRVLFIGEAATLAHVARPLALAAALPKHRYEVVLATPERYRDWTPRGAAWRRLEAQSPAEFAARLRAGRPVFSRSRLEAYVADDLAHIEAVAPQVVVGDLRPSLAASARLAGVPYICISNAYWSPDRPLRPVRPTVDAFRGWPRPLADLAFRAVAGAILRWHARPLDETLRAHGLNGIGRDLRRVFTEADMTLYADLPALFPDLADRPGRRFLGPVIWEPPVAPPGWWDEVPDDKPIAYLTLGSSGEGELLGAVAGWLAAMGYSVMVAAAGQAVIPADNRTLFVADYLPGPAACERADLVICNGGSPTATQALVQGRPVLGLASNMDQLMNIRAVQACGAGLGLRADALGRRRFEAAVNRLSGFRAIKAAAAFAAEARALEPGQVLAAAIDELIVG